MLVRQCKHVALRNSLRRIHLGTLQRQSAKNVHLKPRYMEANEQDYRDWSHQKLIDRVGILEKQIKEQNEK